MHYRFRCYASRYGKKNSIARKRISIKSQIIRNRSADKNPFSTMIVVSDFAGVPELTKYSNILRGLIYVRKTQCILRHAINSEIQCCTTCYKIKRFCLVHVQTEEF